jgi:hypothetical protein
MSKNNVRDWFILFIRLTRNHITLLSTLSHHLLNVLLQIANKFGLLKKDVLQWPVQSFYFSFPLRVLYYAVS